MKKNNQSIWLLLAALVLASMLFVPVIIQKTSHSEVHFMASSFTAKTTVQNGSLFTEKSEFHYNFLLYALNIALPLICVAIIRLVRQRQQRQKYAYATAFLVLVFSVWSMIYIMSFPQYLQGASLSLGVVLPLVAMIFLVLAAKNQNDQSVQFSV